jgi:hypothetical protein
MPSNRNCTGLHYSLHSTYSNYCLVIPQSPVQADITGHATVTSTSRYHSSWNVKLPLRASPTD